MVESPTKDCLDELPFSGNILHHFSPEQYNILGFDDSAVPAGMMVHSCYTRLQACSCPNVSFKGPLVAS